MDVAKAKQWWSECGSITMLNFDDVITLTEIVDDLFAEGERQNKVIYELRVEWERQQRATAEAQAERDRYKAALKEISCNGWPLEMRSIALNALAEAVRP